MIIEFDKETYDKLYEFAKKKKMSTGEAVEWILRDQLKNPEVMRKIAKGLKHEKV